MCIDLFRNCCFFTHLKRVIIIFKEHEIRELNRCMYAVVMTHARVTDSSSESSMISNALLNNKCESACNVFWRNDVDFVIV